jgi:hypothetical protein
MANMRAGIVGASPHNAGGMRAGTLRGQALLDATRADRRRWGRFKGVEREPGDCPRSRGDDGPCIHVGCRHHLCCEIDERTGAIWVDPRFEEDPYSVEDTCAIDVAARAESTLNDIGAMWDFTRERIRQIERDALARLRRRTSLDIMDLLAEEIEQHALPRREQMWRVSEGSYYSTPGRPGRVR